MNHDRGTLLDRTLLEERLRGLRSHARTGWVLSDDALVRSLGGLVGRVLGPRKGERKSRFPRLP